MRTFDLVVIGAGSGLNISSAAAERGLKVAVVEKGPMGGTCLNRGCIPSKIIIRSAEVAELIRKSRLFGINSRISSIMFGKIISRASGIVDKDSKKIEQGMKLDKNVTLFKKEAKFVAERTLKVGSEVIKGNKVIVAAGTRPLIPKIDGLEGSGYITSDEALRLKKQPKSMTIIGGGYIAAELAHFYGALGTKISIIQRGRMLVPNEDEEISRRFTESFRKKHHVFTEHHGEKVAKKKNKFIVTLKNGKSGKKIASEQLLIAVGRIPNTDTLNVKKGNIETDERGFIKTNGYLETSAKNVWAFGDIAGKFLFKHSANLEAQCVYNNAVLGRKLRVDYTAMPHAVFSSPQIAGVGLRERDLIQKKIHYAVGKFPYTKSGMGLALQDNEGFVKILVDKKTRKILGCHILGTEASTLIHEVVVAMKANLTVDAISDAVHIHPALSEVVQRAVRNIEW